MRMRQEAGTMDTDEVKVRGSWRWYLAFTACLAVLIGLFCVDQAAYQFVHDNYNIYTRPVPSSLKIPTRVLRSMEDWGENVYILAVAFAMWRLDSRRRSRVLCLALGALLVAVGIEGVKRVTGRERPEVSKGATVFHGPTKWDEGGDFQSFPSGHTGSAAAYSGAIAAFYPPLRPVAVALAVGCGANRIWKERHFLSDCWFAGVFGFWFAFTLPNRRWMQPLLRWFDDHFSEKPTVEEQQQLARAA